MKEFFKRFFHWLFSSEMKGTSASTVLLPMYEQMKVKALWESDEINKVKSHQTNVHKESIETSELKTKVDDKNFIDIDSSNFNDVMKKIKPRVAFMVPNKLDESTQIAVDISFENMDDFSPAKIAKKVDGLKQILEAREQLANLLSYMDGKAGAEELLNKILNDDALLKALSAKAKETETKE